MKHQAARILAMGLLSALTAAITTQAAVAAPTTVLTSNAPACEDAVDTDAATLEIEQALADLGLYAERIQLPPPGASTDMWYAKVDAIDTDGRVLSFVCDRHGDPLTESALEQMHARAKEERLRKYGVLDHESRRVLESRKGGGAVVRLVLHPELRVPDEPDPAMLPLLDEGVADRLWAEHYDRVREEIEAAKERVRKQLPRSARVLSAEGTGLLVSIPRRDIRALDAIVGLVSASLPESELPGMGDLDTTSQLADQDENIGWDALRQAGKYYDGDQNGTSIRVGIRDSGGDNARVPFGSPLTPRAFFGAPRCCATDDDCGEDNGECIDDGLAGNECAGAKPNVCGTKSHGATALRYFATYATDGRPVGSPRARVYYYGNGGANPNQAAYNWYFSQGVHIANNSQGYQTPAASCASHGSTLYDQAVRDLNIALFKSAGNHRDDAPAGTACADYSSPNQIVVGCSTRGAGVPTLFSSHRNMPGTDVEKPDFLVPGTATSWCSPRAAAVAAALHDMSKDDTGMHYPWLENYPEATKAILMTAAGTNASGTPMSMPNDGTDDDDGAGIVDVSRVERIFNQFRWSIILHNLNDANPRKWRSVHLEKGEALRANIAWSRRATANSTDRPHVDFGLRVWKNGWINAGLDSTYQTSESVYFVAAETGDYDLYLQRWWVDPAYSNTSEIVALAYDIVPGTCFQRCGSYDGSMPCQCDISCAQFGDCCSDRADYCPIVQDDFTAGAPGWQPAFDHPGVAPSSQWFLNGSALVQTANTHKPGNHLAGTAVRRAFATPTQNYEAHSIYAVDDNDVAGVIARWDAGANRYYVCIVNRGDSPSSDGFVQIGKYDNGNYIGLTPQLPFADAQESLTTQQELSLSVNTTGLNVDLRCFHDRREIASATDSNSPIFSGDAGVFNWGMAGYYLHDFTIRYLQ